MESQFSSTALPRISSAPGWIFGLLSLQSAGTGKPSPSRSRFWASRPSQSSSMPFPMMSTAPGWMFGLASLQSTAELKPSRSAVDAPLALGDDVDEVVVDDVVAGTAGDPLRDAVLGVDGVVVALAEVLVDAAPAREGVVAGAASEHVVRRAAEEGVVAGAARDLHREGDVVCRERVVAPGEIDGDAATPGARGHVAGAAPPPVHDASARTRPPPVRLITKSCAVWVIVTSSFSTGISSARTVTSGPWIPVAGLNCTVTAASAAGAARRANANRTRVSRSVTWRHVPPPGRPTQVWIGDAADVAGNAGVSRFRRRRPRCLRRWCCRLRWCCRHRQRWPGRGWESPVPGSDWPLRGPDS